MSYCTKCGESLAGAKMFCAKCGYRTPASGEGGSRTEDVEPDLDRTSFIGDEREEPQRRASLAEMLIPRDDEDEEGAGEEDEEVKKEPVYIIGQRLNTDEVKEALKEEEPVRDRGFIPSCTVCGKDGEAVCIFCEQGLCNDHRKKMAILVNSMPSSKVVSSCEACSGGKMGQVPTSPEARAADFLYAVKPYHEWGLAD